MKAFNFAEDVVSTEVTVTDGFGDGGVGILNGTLLTTASLSTAQEKYYYNLQYNSKDHLSVTYGHIDSPTVAGGSVPDGEKDAYTAFNAYYSFDNGTSISAGYEFGDIGGALATADESINYFVGISSEVGPGELGAAFGTAGGQIEGQDEELMYEAYYSYPVNDGMTITPLVFVKEKAAAGNPDQTGVMVKTSFSF